MGQPQSASSGPTLPMTLGADGRVNFDAVVRQGQRADKVVHSKFSDLLPKPIDEDDPSFQRPDEESIKDLTEKTRDALQRLVESKAAASNPVRSAERTGPAQFIRYTPSQQGAGYNSGSAQRIVRMVEAQKDPMEPPRFRISKKVPRGPPSPPATVMHSPPRKVTSKEQADWKIPPCVSNWKNPKGYTIPLDKRVAADGRGLQGVHVNEKFVMLAEALHTAEVKSREAVSMRAKVASRMQQAQREKHEETLQQIASRARGERAGLAPAAEAAEAAAEARERDAIRRERAEQRAHERNRKGGGGANDRDRDISEQIALGRPALQRNQQDPEAAFDSRLFNQDAGLASGFHAGEDEIYNVYDQPWRANASSAGHLYRPTKGLEEGASADEELGRLASGTGRFVPDRRFEGTGGGAGGSRRDGPVQFEKQVEEDPFGLDDLFDKVKRSETVGTGSKRPASGHRDEGGSGRKRDRRD
ncbi:hypothetical protein BOX15_Mlig010975g1 [Macrostomum lignano]|nr:hypothetical protein BOX15_Mlig010975g1 [Macrostomum lignano]